MNYKSKNLSIIALLSILSIFLVYSSGETKITGICANCHTMHSSQNGTSGGIAFGGSSLPQPVLLRGTCFGCHGQGGANKIVTISGSDIPQVYHTDPSGDLAGGNFRYLSTNDNRGHNVKDIGNADDILNAAPGILPESGHNIIITDTNLTCAGYIGCHGSRYNDGKATTGIPMLKGAHHSNVDGKCETDIDKVYGSYRFLLGVKGLENTSDKWQNKDANSHNEYFGDTTPMNVSCANTCHLSGGVQPPNHTISGFCATCHGLFHDLSSIGGDTISPFTRHPTDIVIKNDGEYSAYTTYSVEAPVARGAVPDGISSTVTPGNSGIEGAIVMCLSCHAVHGTNYPDILRWNYDDMIAGDNSKSGGCFTCHTQKNQAT